MLTITINEREAVCRRVGPITAGSVGLPVRFCFSAAWEGLSRVAVFRGSGASADVALLTDECVVPAEVLTTPGGSLTVGVWGGDAAGTTVIPTVWVRAGRIEEGTEPSGVEPAAPTPSWAAQVQAAAQEALEKAEAVAQAAEDGDFDGEDGLSPTLAVSAISGGHRVTVTDANGTRSFDVLDGADGQSGGGTVVVVASMSGLTITADHTYAELAAAAQADTPIVLLLTDGATEYVCTSCKVYASKISFDLKPQWVDVVGGGVTNLMSYRVDVSADGWEFWVSQSQLTPASIGAAEATAVPSAYTSTPAALGTASPGSSAKWAKGDHVHAMPSASDVGAAPAITEVAVSTAGAVTQALDAGKLYHFTGALTALTVTLNAAGTGVIPQYHFDFDSGAAAPTLTLPNTVTMPDGFAVEANKHYEIDILNGYGVVSAWTAS